MTTSHNNIISESSRLAAGSGVVLNPAHTISRSKIGSHLSYPVKFLELNELLSPTMADLGIGVRFTAWNAPRQNEEWEVYPIITASYTVREAGCWELNVSPVPRSQRKEVRSLFLPALTGQVRPWLMAKRKPGWYMAYHALHVMFDTADQKMLFHERNSV